jgi:CheY-like chemotaxis protein
VTARPTVLTIDDNQIFLGTLAVLLERLQFEVLPVTSTRDALDLARVVQPQVITLSMQMPDMDSLEFMRTLRADTDLAELPVIMITSQREKQQVWEAMSLGCIEVLDKPLEVTRLHQALQRCNLYKEGRRRYLRAPFTKPVAVSCRGEEYQLTSVTLSERGIMVRMANPLPRGADVTVRFPLPQGGEMHLPGQVIYVRGTPSQVGPPPGVTIRFDRLTIKDTEQLHALVKQLLIGDILEKQDEPVIKAD